MAEKALRAKATPHNDHRTINGKFNGGILVRAIVQKQILRMFANVEARAERPGRGRQLACQLLRRVHFGYAPASSIMHHRRFLLSSLACISAKSAVASSMRSPQGWFLAVSGQAWT